MPFDATALPLALRYNLVPDVFNPNSGERLKLRGLMGSLLISTTLVRLLCVGDSLTYGQGTLGDIAAVFNQSYPAALAREVNARDARYNAVHSTIYGAAGASTLADSLRTSMAASTTTWIPVSTGNPPMGSKFWRANSGDTTGKLSFNPGYNADTFRIHYGKGPGGVFNYEFNGGSPVNVDTAGTQAFGIEQITTTLGNNTINVRQTAPATTRPYMAGFAAWDSTRSTLLIENGGMSGTSTIGWTATAVAYGPFGAIPAIAPHHSIINLGTNDVSADPTSLDNGQFVARYQQIINQCKTTGSVTMINPSWAANSQRPTALQNKLTDLLKGLALANDCSLVDFKSVMRSYNEANALGLLNGDQLHITALGYAVQARAVANYLLS